VKYARKLTAYLHTAVIRIDTEGKIERKLQKQQNKKTNGHEKSLHKSYILLQLATTHLWLR